MVGKSPRYRLRCPFVRIKSRATDNVVGCLSTIFCCLIFTTSMGHVIALVSSSLAWIGGEKSRWDVRPDETRAHSRQSDLSERWLSIRIIQLRMHEEPIACKHQAVQRCTRELDVTQQLGLCKQHVQYPNVPKATQYPYTTL